MADATTPENVEDAAMGDAPTAANKQSEPASQAQAHRRTLTLPSLDTLRASLGHNPYHRKRVYAGSSPRKYAFRDSTKDVRPAARAPEATVDRLPSTVNDGSAPRPNTLAPLNNTPDPNNGEQQIVSPLPRVIMGPPGFLVFPPGPGHHHHRNETTSPRSQFAMAPPLAVNMQGPLTPLTPISPTMVSFEFQALQRQLHEVQDVYVKLHRDHEKTKANLTDLANNNAGLHRYINALNIRTARLEAENAAFSQQLVRATPAGPVRHAPTIQRTLTMSPGHLADNEETDEGEPQTPSQHGATSDGTQSASGSPPAMVPATAPSRLTGPSTPSTRHAARAPTSASATVATAGPVANTSPYPLLSKRKVHNLNSMMPPIFVVMPWVPLTDMELIVYFYSTVARPVVSLRLYGRGLGPANICQILNDHRNIDPPYLRNTCSVKCVTAQRRGVERYGEEWCDQMKLTFSQCDDAQATRLLEVKTDDTDEPQDIDILTLCRGLRKHPEIPGHPGKYSIFAKCVMWAESNNQSWKLSEVQELARAIEQGRTPEPEVIMDTEGIMSFLNEDAMDHTDYSGSSQDDTVVDENAMGLMSFDGDAIGGDGLGEQLEV